MAIIQPIISIVEEKTGMKMQKHFMPIEEQILDQGPGKLCSTLSLYEPLSYDIGPSAHVFSLDVQHVTDIGYMSRPEPFSDAEIKNSQLKDCRYFLIYSVALAL
ncbi:hypothetical protein TRIUR3_29806 [Triticum urartu]|uniref:Uncharacterized protein n=1 Tax=Triticum urartu TaxID=4572 RepID=M7ZFN8_TRIUA|nr:hypothetical protein TRIUR3_29806 [Triticum urartu]